jgi:adenosine kinase
MLIVTGSIAFDYIMEFPGSFSDHILPEHRHNINLSFIVNKFAKRRGGTAGNVSYTLGLLGLKHILFSYAGKDFEEYKADFTKIGIDVSKVEIDPDDHTATGFAMADAAQNQIWGFYYGASARNKFLQLQKVANKDDFVLIGPQGAEGSLSLINQCISLDIPYMFDPGFILTQVNNVDLEHGLTHANYIIGNDYEVALLNDRVKQFKNITEKAVIITTKGEKGAIIEKGHERYNIKPTKAIKVASTTGAGDAWRAGFLTGIDKGFDLQTSGQMGAVAASYAVEYFGTQDHTFTKQVFAKRYLDVYNTEINI